MRLWMLSISTLPSSKLQCLHPYSCSGSDWLRQNSAAWLKWSKNLLLRARMVCCWMMANPPLIEAISYEFGPPLMVCALKSGQNSPYGHFPLIDPYRFKFGSLSSQTTETNG